MPASIRRQRQHNNPVHSFDQRSSFCQVLVFAFKTCHSKCTLLLMIYIGLAVLNEIMVYFLGLLSSFYIPMTVDNNKHSTLAQISLKVSAAVALISFLAAFQEWVLTELKANMRKKLTLHLQRCYMRQSHFIHVNKLGIEFHHDQVIAHDAYRVCHYFVKWLSMVIIPLVVINLYIFKAVSTFGIPSTTFLSIYFVVFVSVTTVIAIPLRRATFMLQRDEGSFRFKHAILREHTDLHYISNGMETELKFLSSKLKVVVKTMRKLAFYSTFVEFFTNWFQFSCPILIIMCYRYGALLEIEYNESAQRKIFQSTVGLFFAQKILIAFTAIVNSTKTFARLRAHVGRVSKLLKLYQVVDDYLKNEKVERSESNSLHSEQLSCESLIKWNPADLIVVSNLRLYLPANDKLIGNTFNFVVKRFHSLGITGPNGCGKSTLLRFICGLLKPRYGMVRKCFELDFPKAMLIFFPSSYYPSTHTIYDQLVYPYFHIKEECNFYTDADYCLKVVGLHYFCGDSLQHNSEHNIPLLSTGEQQRLMFAKILFFKPIIAEDTIQLFNLCMEKSITFVTVSQNIELLKQTHHCLLKIDFNDSIYKQYYR